MPTHRRIIVNVFVVVLIAGSAVSIVTGREYWPFSRYWMFAHLQGPRMTAFEVVGMTAEEPSREVPLDIRRATSSPISKARFTRGLTSFIEKEGLEAGRDLLADMLARYERNRTRKQPQLRSLHLYRTTWEVVPGSVPSYRRVEREVVLSAGAEGEER
jgi:hypothetical protein